MLKSAVEKYRDGMVFYALQFLKDRTDSEDVVQEIFVKFWETESLNFENEKALKTYLYRTVHNRCLNKLGRKDVFKYRVDVYNQEVREERHVTFDANILTEIGQEIDRLAPRTREVFRAVFLESKKYQQVADELNISVNTVKLLLKNGVKQIRARFKGREDKFLYHFLFML